jgi:K+-sensing histidine kinase KdpD
LICIIFFTIESQDTIILENYKKFKSDEELKIKKRQEFLVNISYQVRTPMHNVIGYGNLIDEKYNLTVDEANLICQDVKNSVLSLRDIVRSIIDISKLQNNEVSVNQTNYDTRVLLGNINSYVFKNKLKENLHFSISIDENIPVNLYGDMDKIFYIVTRILDNSIFTTDYGEIKLEVLNNKLDSEYTELSFNIYNSGHVMTEEMYNMQFEDYISNKENINPIKIGLTIAKSYIDLLGGNIEFINKEGQGTRYYVKIRQKIVNTTTSSIQQ